MASIPDTCDLFVVQQRCQTFFYRSARTAFRHHLSSFRCSIKVRTVAAKICKGNVQCSILTKVGNHFQLSFWLTLIQYPNNWWQTMHFNSLQQIKDNCSRRLGRYWIFFFRCAHLPLSNLFFFLLWCSRKKKSSVVSWIWFWCWFCCVCSIFQFKTPHQQVLFTFFHIKWLGHTLVIAGRSFWTFVVGGEAPEPELVLLGLCLQLKGEYCPLMHYGNTLLKWIGCDDIIFVEVAISQ